MIRPATQADLPAITALHVSNWQATYRGLLSNRFLDHVVPTSLAEKWATLPDNPVLVSEAGGRFSGFIDLIPGEPAHVGGLHVDPAWQGRGLGRALLVAAAGHLRALGQKRLDLLVLDGNEGAERLYRRLGAVETWRGLDDHFDEPVTAIRLEWTDLSTMLRS